MQHVSPETQPKAGRYLVLLSQDDFDGAVQQLGNLAQVQIHRAPAAGITTLGESCAVVYDRIGAAYVHCTDPARLRLIQAAAGGGAILAIEPERTVYAIGTGASPAKRKRPSPKPDETGDTWGVLAVGADASTQTGQGIRIAVLDTGLDLLHPDFAGRSIETKSFVAGQHVQDGNGHGTHCAGIAAGPAKPARQVRYGVAGEAELYVGKVLGDEGSGGDGGILEGIDWAIRQRCQIISMSLGSPVEPGQHYSAVFEEVARRALAAGTLIVAAAGNDSQRPESIAPVGHPANCPSIMAVAAVDRNLDVAPFSSGGLEGDGGEIDLAGPGVDVLSSWPAPDLYRTLSGTSMATPFVAGVAALYAQSDPKARGSQLWDQLLGHVRPLKEARRDVGAGLVQAPGAVTRKH